MSKFRFVGLTNNCSLWVFLCFILIICDETLVCASLFLGKLRSDKEKRFAYSVYCLRKEAVAEAKNLAKCTFYQKSKIVQLNKLV